eukprot:COSAG01_NODE_52_length_31456_cov_125.226648_2_plen_709_part_00
MTKSENNLSLKINPQNNIATINFDLKNESVNKLSKAVMTEFESLIEKISLDKKIKALIIKSTKKNIFIAGADINEIQNIKDKKDAASKLKQGNDLLNKLEKLEIPTIAAINGACLGGGLELALACTYRIVSNNTKTILGQPEVNLGIIPGFGGTQRLPKLIGLRNALQIIVSGKGIPAKKAYKMHLADAYIHESFFAEEVENWAQNTLSKSKIKIKRYKHKIIDKSPILRRLICKQAIKMTNAKLKAQYPAPIKAIEVIQKSMGKSLKKGLKIEQKAFSELVTDSISKNLIQLFFSQESNKKQIKKDISSPDQVAVVGAGLMGAGITWTLSHKNIKTSLKDIEWKNINKGLNSIYKIYKSLQKRKRWNQNMIQNYMHQIEGTLDYNSFKNKEIIIEAVFEDMLVKKKILKEIEKVNPNSIIASNTSSLSICDMAKTLIKPEKFIGLHFFSPVNRMPLVEIIPGEKTNQDTIDKTLKLTQRLNKTAIVVKNCPGFLVNRILIPYVNEAIYNLEDGAEIKELDTLMTHFGMPLGPLALADQVGIDIGYKVAKVLENGYGERMKVCPLFETLVTQTQDRGKKTGKGFYNHKNKKTETNQRFEKIIKQRQKEQVKKHNIHSDCLDRMILTMVNEATKCLEEKVVKSANDLDLAMIMGTGFPAFRGGICKYIDQRGAKDIVEKLHYLAETYHARFKPSNYLQHISKNNKKIYQ